MAGMKFVKSSTDVLDYKIDWSAWLKDDIIVSSSWTLSDGITKMSDTFTTTVAVVWISGGQAGRTYTASNTITTSGGRVVTRAFDLEVQ